MAADVVLALLATSAASLAVAPTVVPDSYSWLSHTTSESGAQGVEGAWLARLGFLIFGLAVIWLAQLARPTWGPWGTAFHTVFGVFMTATAAFSAGSWEQGARVDQTEDLLHSVASSTLGFAFVLGVLAVLLRRAPDHLAARMFDVIAIAAAIALPIGMGIWGDLDGLLQRVMFLVAYAWYATEAMRSTGEGPVSPRAAA